jgi:predicted dehydrogenase
MNMKEKIKIGVVGAGWWATHNHIPLIADNPHAELAAVCRLGADELKKVKDTFGFAYATEDYDAMLENTELDGVVITTPHHLHFEQACKALEKGLHVMVEKPMTTNSQDARELVALSQKVNREILIPHGWNFRPYVTKARELISSGSIGEIRHVSMQMASPAEALFSGQIYPGTEVDMFQPPATTWADPNNYGGYGWGQFPHILGCLFCITDLAPNSVMAVSSASSTGVDLFNAVIIQFENGVNGTLSGAGTVPMNSKFQVDIRLFGSEGMLLLDMERERLIVRRHDDNNTEVEIKPGDGDYHCEEPVHRFIDICRGKDVINEAPGIVGKRSIEVIDAMYRSIKSGHNEKV